MTFDSSIASADSTPPGPPRSLTSRLSKSEVLDRLDRRARQGKLPGFARRSDSSCRLLIFAGAFDHELVLHLSLQDDGATRITPTLRMLRRTPVILWVVLALTMYPGLPLTDSMLRAYFQWYDSASMSTWWWYVPLTLLAVPVVLKQLRSARREASVEAGKTMAQIASLVEA